MMYIAVRTDGSVAVIVLVPIAAKRKEDGAILSVMGVRRRGDSGNGACVLWGAEFEIEVGEYDFDLSSLEKNSVPGFTLIFPDVEKDVIAKWPPVSAKEIVSVRKCKKEEIPEDRTFRDAWRHSNKKIKVDMDVARNIHKDHLRRAREPVLKKLDMEYMRADETGNDEEKSKVVMKKQALRDAPNHPDIDSAKTPEELKAFWPAELDQ